MKITETADIRISYAVKFSESLLYMLMAAYTNFSLFRLSLKTVDSLGMVTVAFILTSTGILFAILYIQLARKISRRYVEMCYWDISFGTLSAGLRFMKDEPAVRRKYVAILKTDRFYWILMTVMALLCATGVALYWRSEMKVILLPLFCALALCFASNWHLSSFDIRTTRRLCR